MTGTEENPFVVQSVFAARNAVRLLAHRAAKGQHYELREDGTKDDYRLQVISRGGGVFGTIRSQIVEGRVRLWLT